MTLSKYEIIRQKSDLIYSAEQIKCAINRLAMELESHLADRSAHILCIMNGALLFTSDLVRHLDDDLKIDYCQISSYGNDTIGGELQWQKRPQYSMQDQVIIVLDDIFDRGHTLKTVISYCHSQGAKEVISCVLLRKKLLHRDVTMQPDFFGLEVDDHYVFGYGMDYRGHLRHLPDIYALKEP